MFSELEKVEQQYLNSEYMGFSEFNNLIDNYKEEEENGILQSEC